MKSNNVKRLEDGWFFHNHAWHLWHEIVKVIAQLCPDGDILDFGAGPGISTAFLQSLFPEARIFATDIDQNSLKSWQYRDVRGEICDITKDIFSSIPNKYDMIICSHVIEHIENPEIVVGMLANMTSFLVLIVPDGHAGDPDHKKIYDRQTFKQLIDTIDYNNLDYFPVYHPHINNLMAVIS